VLLCAECVEFAKRVVAVADAQVQFVKPKVLTCAMEAVVKQRSELHVCDSDYKVQSQAVCLSVQ
jgi:hypothetical protein